MSDQQDRFLDELIQRVDSSLPKPLTIEEGDFTYYLQCVDLINWTVRKLSAKYALDYAVTNYRGRWYCSCPAGDRRRRCKHVVWVETISDSPAWKKLYANRGRGT